MSYAFYELYNKKLNFIIIYCLVYTIYLFPFVFSQKMSVPNFLVLGFKIENAEEVQTRLVLNSTTSTEKCPSIGTHQCALIVMMNLAAFLAGCPTVAFACSVVPSEYSTIILVITGILVMDGSPYKFAIKAFRYGPPPGDHTKITFDITRVTNNSENSWVAVIYDAFERVVRTNGGNRSFACLVPRFNATMETMRTTAREITTATRATLMTEVHKLTTEDPRYFWFLTDDGMHDLVLAIHRVFSTESDMMVFLILQFIEECVRSTWLAFVSIRAKKLRISYLLLFESQGMSIVSHILDWCAEKLDDFAEEQPDEDINQKLFRCLILESIARLLSLLVKVRDLQDSQDPHYPIFSGLLHVSDCIGRLLEHGHGVPAEEKQ